MKPKQAKKQFQQCLSLRGVTLSQLNFDMAVHEMFDFFKQYPAEGCADDEGDMLLFQWGFSGVDGDQSYLLDITRQFMVDDDDETIFQLGLSFRFLPEPLLEAIESGNFWCESLDELDNFKTAVKSNAAYRLLSETAPREVELNFEKL